MRAMPYFFFRLVPIPMNFPRYLEHPALQTSQCDTNFGVTYAQLHRGAREPTTPTSMLVQLVTLELPKVHQKQLDVNKLSHVNIVINLKTWIKLHISPGQHQTPTCLT